jgi:transposase
VSTSYKCRIYPTPEQVIVLNRTFGCVRVVWNRTLAWRHARYHSEQSRTNFTQANAYLTAMKGSEETGWLNEVSSVPLQQAIRHQQTAFSNFFAGRAGYPRYKSRTGRQSAEYKAARAGRDLIVIDRWYPSSKTCSACGHLLGSLSLSTRHWTCPSCGTRHDRDVNAAQHILAAGLAVAQGDLGDACGADVRHSGSSRMQSAVKQEPRPVTARVPPPSGRE